MKNAPYTLIQRRIDVVIRVPQWASEYISKGDQVIRLDAISVIAKNKQLRLGESYTKFSGYTQPGV